MLSQLKFILFLYLCSEVVNASFFGWLYQLSGDDRSFVVAAINNKRNNHKYTPPIQWSKDIAYEVTDKLSYWNCRNTDDIPSDKYGYTLYTGHGGLREAINGWYDGLEHFDFKHPKFTKLNRNFVQVASKNVQQIGCGERLCGKTNVYLCGFDKPNTYKAFLNDSIEPLLVDVLTAIETDVQYSTETQVVSQISTNYQTLLTVNTNTIFLTQLSTDYQTHNFTNINTITNTQLSTITHVQNVTNTNIITQVHTSINTKTQNVTATKVLTDVRVTTATETEYITNTDTVTLTDVSTSIRDTTLTENHSFTETETERTTQTNSMTIFSTITEVSTLLVTQENPVTISDNVTVTNLKTEVETLNITVVSPVTHTVHLTERQIVVYTNNITLTEVDVESHTSYITTYEVITETLPIEIDFTETLTETNTLKYTHTESIIEVETEMVYVTNTIKVISTVVETTTDKESITETEIHSENVTIIQPMTITINLTQTETVMLTDLVTHTETDIRNQTLSVTTYDIQTLTVPISLVSTETLFQTNTDTYTLTETETATSTFTEITTGTTVQTRYLTSTVLQPFTETKFKTRTEQDIHNFTLIEPVTRTIDFTKTETVVNTDYMTFTEIDTFNHTSLLTTFEIVTETFPISIFYTETFTTTNMLEYTFTELITEKQTELVYETNSVIETSIIPTTITVTTEVTKHEVHTRNVTITEPITHIIHSTITETALKTNNLTITDDEISSTTSVVTIYEKVTVTLPVYVVYTETVTESDMPLTTVTQTQYPETATETITITVHDSGLASECSKGGVNSTVASKIFDALGRSTKSESIASEYSSVQSESTAHNNTLSFDQSSKDIVQSTQLNSFSTSRTLHHTEEPFPTDNGGGMIDGGPIFDKPTMLPDGNENPGSSVLSTVLSNSNVEFGSIDTSTSLVKSVGNTLDAGYNTHNSENAKSISSTESSSISSDLDGAEVSISEGGEPSGTFKTYSSDSTLISKSVISTDGNVFDYSSDTNYLAPLVRTTSSEISIQSYGSSSALSSIVPTVTNIVVGLVTDSSAIPAYTDSDYKSDMEVGTNIGLVDNISGSSRNLIKLTTATQLEHEENETEYSAEMTDLYSVSKTLNVTMTTGPAIYTGQIADDNGNIIDSRTRNNSQYRKNISFATDQDLPGSLSGTYTDLNSQTRSQFVVSGITPSSQNDSTTITPIISSNMYDPQATVTTTAFIVSNNAIKERQVSFSKFTLSVLLTAAILII